MKLNRFSPTRSDLNTARSAVCARRSPRSCAREALREPATRAML
uniref:Uncharacterized protein n=1 Tax=Arundo donax TaxID=35708 RepID=A0A0A9AS13_ARUDO